LEVLKNPIYVVAHSNIDELVYWFIGYDVAKPHDLIISFRGTQNWKDAIIDAMAIIAPVRMTQYTFYAHQGMQECIHRCYNDIIGNLYQYLSNHEVSSLSITGHSLGGGYAIIFYLYLYGHSFVGENIISSENLVKTIPNINVYTIGAPTIIARPESWSPLMEQIEDKIHNFVHNFDIVPRLLGNKMGSSVLSLLSKFLNEEKGLGLVLKQFSNDNFVRNIKSYKPYGLFTYLKSSRSVKGGEVVDSKHQMILAMSYVDKKGILALPMARMIKLGPHNSVPLLTKDHYGKNYVDYITVYLSDINKN